MVRQALLLLFVLLALCAGTGFAETKVLQAASRFNPADVDVGEIRDFVKKGGYVVCTDALYRPIWKFLGEVEPGFGDVKWKVCESWKADGDSRTAPTGKVPHPIVSFPNAYDDADYWGHFIGGTCKGWTVLAACGDGEPMILYRSLGKGGIVVCANLWWFGKVPKILMENIDAWAALNAAGVKAKSAEIAPLRNGKGRVSIALASAQSRKMVLELTVTPEGGRKSVFSKKFASDGVTLDYALDFVGKAEIELAVVADKDRTTIFTRQVDFAPPLTLAPADNRGHLSTARRTDVLWLTADINPAKAKCNKAAIRYSVMPAKGGKTVAKGEARLPEKDVPTRFTFPIEFPCSAPAGKYTISADLKPSAEAPAGKAATTVEVVEPSPGQFIVDADGVILRDGKPFFPLGIYHVNPPYYEEVRKLGFNFVQSFKYKILLDKGIPIAEKEGLSILVEGDYRDVPLHALDFLLNKPTTAMWYVADEPNETHAEGVRAAYEAYHNWDKSSLTYITSNRPDLFGWLSGFAGVFSCDCYGDMGKCVDWLRRANRTIRPGQAFVFIPAAIPRDPRYLRVQAYLGIAHGATGLIWYCWEDDAHPNEALKGRDEQKGEFKTLLAELNANAEYLTAAGRERFESGAVHGIVLGDPSQTRKAFVVNVLDKPSKASVKLGSGASLNVSLDALEAEVLDVEPVAGKRTRR